MTTLGSTGGLFLLLSVTCCLFSNSWLMVWMTLEINTMSFCAVLLFILGKETLHKESIMKYFMVQSVASALLLLSSSYEMENSAFMLVWLMLAILMKMGSTPFHQWFINVSCSMPLPGALMLMTIQKVLPIFLTSLVKSSAILTFAVMNMMLGTISQYYTKKLLIMLSLSSVANLSWLILASQLCLSTMWTMVTIYMANVTLVFAYMHKGESKETNKSTGNTVGIMMMLSSLAGMPPLMVFLPKWIISKEMITHSTLMPIIFLLTLSSISMYIYLRMFTPMLITSPSVKGSYSGSKTLNVMLILTMLFSTVMI